MGDAEILSEEPISMGELLDEIKKIKKRDEEVSFRVTKVEDYLNQFLQAKKKTNDELITNITGLEIPRLKEAHIIKIADIMPTSADDVKLALQGYPISVSSDNLKKIASAVQEFAPATVAAAAAAPAKE